MKLMVVAVGAPKRPVVADAIAEYDRRIRHYFSYEVREIQPGPMARSGSTASGVDVEAERLIRSVPDDLETVALDERGQQWTSEELAAYIHEMAVLARPGAAFLIGGPEGHGPELRKRVDRVLALSRFTLPHELARLFLAEQLYRAGTILRGEPYHRGQ